MKYTRDELARKLVAEIEPMPTEPSIYYTVSPMGMWVYVCRQWIPARTIQPLTSLGDAVRCAEAAGLRFLIGPEDVSDYDGYMPGIHNEVIIFEVAPNGEPVLELRYAYTDGNHALALALATASARDGERAEVVG